MTYLPYSYSGVCDQNEQNDEGFDKGRHGSRLVFVFFEQGENLQLISNVMDVFLCAVDPKIKAVGVECLRCCSVSALCKALRRRDAECNGGASRERSDIFRLF